MAERDRSKVTLVLTEGEARDLLGFIGGQIVLAKSIYRIEDELKHALAECECKPTVCDCSEAKP